MGNVVFFQDSGLWVSDGTAAGTYAVGGLRNAGVAGTNGSLNASSITQFRDGVLFRGLARRPSDVGLWFSDGTAAGTYEIGGAYNSGVVDASSRGLDPGDFGSGPGEIAVFGSKALFFGEDSDNFIGLWVTDGTASGTSELGGLKNSGIAGTHFNGLSPRNLTPAGDGRQGVLPRDRHRWLFWPVGHGRNHKGDGRNRRVEERRHNGSARSYLGHGKAPSEMESFFLWTLVMVFRRDPNQNH